MNVYKLLLFTFVLFCNNLFAQRTSFYTDSLYTYKQALELFNKEKFGQAQKLFAKNKNSFNNKIYSNEIETATFYEAVCAYELFNNDAELLLSNYLKIARKNQKYYQANYYLANFLYRKKRYKNALSYFEMLKPTNIEKELLGDYYFKKGYCFFDQKKLEEAKLSFYEIKEEENRYGNSANYYYSHISYLQKNYQTALEGFLKLESNDIYKYLSQYYISQIYFLQKKYDQLNAYIPKVLNDSIAYNKEQLLELNKLQGYAYYQNQNYSKAITYLKKYNKAIGNVSRYDNFILANSYYKTNQYKSAEVIFPKICTEKDSLSQISSYQLADCFVKNENKKNAINAFDYASELSFYKDIQEDALFNFAKLSYELDINPFNNAIKAFEKYLNTYPTSKRIDEVNEYLTNVYLTTKNYDDALKSIENINVKSNELNAAYQRVAYYKAIQLYKDARFEDALIYFKKSDDNNYNKNIKAQSTYWQAETHYQLAKYDVAQKMYEDFIYSPAAVLQEVFNNAHYNIGYCYFQTKQYDNAKIWFRKFINYKFESNINKLADANLRLADCYFITKNTEDALQHYENAIGYNKMQVDYALYQSGIIANLTKNSQKAINYLETLKKNYPKSKYLAEANYELGNTYLANGNTKEADVAFNSIIQGNVNSIYYKKSLLKKAIIYYNDNKDTEALVLYKEIIKNYPNTEESKQALNGVQNILIEQGKAEEFTNYVQTIPNANYSNAALDSLNFLAAEKQYFKEDCVGAIASFGNYLKNFKEGFFFLRAAYYKADCEFRNKDYDNAIKSYNLISNGIKNKYTETALLRSARIYNFQNKNSDAYLSYKKLEQIADQLANIEESKVNIMVLTYTEKKFEENIIYVDKVLQIEKLSEDILQDAQLYKLKSLLALKDSSNALAQAIAFSNTGKTASHTEAKFIKTQLLYANSNFVDAEKNAYEIINQEPTYDKWIVESFLLLSDIFKNNGDRFSAKNTLKSILDNSDNADVIKRAQDKMAVIEELEKQDELLRLARPLPSSQTNEEIVDLELFTTN